MDRKFKIILINHSFQINYYSRRWQLFAMSYPNVDVTLLAPKQYIWYKDKAYTYGAESRIQGKEIDELNFHVKTFRVKSFGKFGWTSPDFKKYFIEIQPDVVYHLGVHTQLSLVQVIRLAKRNIKNIKIIVFSMRSPNHSVRIVKSKSSLVVWVKRRIQYFYTKAILNYVNKNCDAIFCHYPNALQAFRDEGYNGPVYMQTQVGVNTEWFHQDEEARNEIREKYNLGDAYVFGSATRFTKDKGIFDIIEALPSKGNWKYLMMGAGSAKQEDALKDAISIKGLQDKIILTGFVDWYDMAKYWNAIDCAIHVPKTTEKWIETFSLSVTQAMITGKPVIGNTSGSVPYQLGPEGIIVPEGDVKALREKMEWVLNNPKLGEEYGIIMFERARSCFSVQRLNELFYSTLIDIIDDKYDFRKVDMTC